MKILVTGGAGYIGSHTIIEILENTSWEVISADSFLRSTPKTFDRIKKITGKRIKNYNVDLCDLESTRKIFLKNPDITGVIHFAALKSVPESVENPALYYKNNIEPLKGILSCVKEFGVKYFIFSSSCSVYGNIDKLPVSEITPLKKPQSPYAGTKQMGENIIFHFSKGNQDASFISLRYFNPVGAHVSGMIGEVATVKPYNIATSIIRTALGESNRLNVFGGDYPTRDGTCIRDYVHVSDIATAHINTMQHLIDGKNKSNYDVINIGTGSGVTVLELIQAFEKVSGKKLNYKIFGRRDGDIGSIYSDSSKAKKTINWNPKYTTEQMMESAWKWAK